MPSPRRILPAVAVLVGVLAAGLPSLAAPDEPDAPTVAVLSAPGLAASGTPSGLTPEVITELLNAQGIDAELVDPAGVRSDVRAIVNPYGQAYPATDAVEAALDAGSGWVNLAGVPFLAPHGVGDPEAPARHGVFAPWNDAQVLTGAVATELGAAWLPTLPPTLPYGPGASIHAGDPADERPLARYVDSDGTDGGPAVVLLRRPHRIVAVGYVGEDHPLHPSLPGSGPLLADLVRVAADRSDGLTDVEAVNDGEGLVVTASQAGPGLISGTGRFPAPERWSPDHPESEWATVRLEDGQRLVDVVRVPANPAEVMVKGDQILVNGEPFKVKGMGPGHSFPPGTDAATSAEMLRDDVASMREAGVNAIRSWGPRSDWWLNTAAREGVFMMDALALGWTYELTEPMVAAQMPWAGFIGARARNHHNVLVLSVGNEILDPDARRVEPALERLVEAARIGNDGVHPVTYAAHETSLLAYGSLPFLDIYSFNDYGMTWPLSVDTAGFVGALQYAKTTKAEGRPLLVTEWGVNGWPGSAASQAGAPGRDALELAQAEVLYEKWVAMETLGAAGGFTYIWVDPLDHDLPIPNYLQLVGAVEYPPGTGYHPLNEEEFWGLNDVSRRHRQAYWALRYAYSGQGGPPVADLSALGDFVTPPAPPPEQLTPTGDPEADELRPLHADGPVLRDDFDREILLRGIAVIEKAPPHLPDVGPVDFQRIRSWGLNSIRLGISWAGVMPEEGVVDTAYLDRLRRIVDHAADAGLYIVVDMHQDLFGRPYGNGAPAWATRTDCPHTDWASLTGAWATNYFSPAVACAFMNFWLSEDLQSSYADAWQAVAESVGDSAAVVGYDLMNEPYQAAIPSGVFETRFLYPSQARWLAAIRQPDPDAVGFLEPSNAKNVHLPTTPTPTPPANAVFAPHVYGLWDASEDLSVTRSLADANVAWSRQEAGVMGLPLWLGEFGVRAGAAGAADFVTHVFDLADDARAGAAYWEYAGSYSPINPDGTERPLLGAIVRAYPRAVAGTVVSIDFDADLRQLEVAWSQDESGVALFEVPTRLFPEGIVVDGVADWSLDAGRGVLTVRTGPGDHDVTVRPA